MSGTNLSLLAPVYYQPLTATVGQCLQSLRPTQTLFIIDTGAYQHHTSLIDTVSCDKPNTHRYFFTPTEANKTLQSLEQFWAAMANAHLDRKSLVIAIGGGITTDAVAFAAACWMRGVRFILVPTTLLSMVDATIGGKTGVNFRGAKNMIGTFATPEAIIIDTTFLQSLDARTLLAGMAEVLKHGLIYDAAYYTWLKSGIPQAASDWNVLLKRSLEIKQAVVESDPREAGPRKILNFGHTVGHAYESALANSAHPLLHGEAVAIGMAIETQLSVQFAGLSNTEATDILQTLQHRYAFPLKLQTNPDPTVLQQYLQQDKKNENTTLKFVLLKSIGEAVYDVEVSMEAVMTVVNGFETL